MPLKIEGVVDGVRFEKALRRVLRFEVEHLSLASSHDEMGLVDAIVLAELAGPVTIIESDFAQSRSLGLETVGDDGLRFDMLISQQPPQQSQCSSSVATFLHNHVHHFALVVDRAPEEHALATDFADHFIEAPARRGRLFASPKVCRDLRSELDGPASNGLATDFDATLSQHLLDIAQAEGEAEVEPNGVIDDRRREAAPLVGYSRYWGLPSPKTGYTRDHFAFA